jgi:hypothetical protein
VGAKAEALLVTKDKEPPGSREEAGDQTEKSGILSIKIQLSTLWMN